MPPVTLPPNRPLSQFHPHTRASPRPSSFRATRRPVQARCHDIPPHRDARPRHWVPVAPLHVGVGSGVRVAPSPLEREALTLDGCARPCPACMQARMQGGRHTRERERETGGREGGSEQVQGRDGCRFGPGLFQGPVGADSRWTCRSSRPSRECRARDCRSDATSPRGRWGV